MKQKRTSKPASHEEKVMSTLEKMAEKIHSIDLTLAKQEENLKIHMYRTELSEKRLEHIENVLAPINKHVSGVEGVLKFLGVLSVVLGIILTFLKIFSVI